MLHVTVPNLPETLTYSVLAAIGIAILIAILLAVHGDPLGVVLVLAVAAPRRGSGRAHDWRRGRDRRA
jgi:hypothetical protein